MRGEVDALIRVHNASTKSKSCARNRERLKKTNANPATVRSSTAGRMKIIGIDFTSCPTLKKPITCLACVLKKGVLSARDLRKLNSCEEFESTLTAQGPWIAGIDFPFGQSRKFIENMGWPRTWSGYVTFVSGLGRLGFCRVLDSYRETRAWGDKEHRRATDVTAGAISPQKLHGVPVAKMFYEGSGRLIKAGVTVPGLLKGDQTRIVVEAYPGVVARKFIDKQSYKNDSKKKQTNTQWMARQNLLKQITGVYLAEYGFSVSADTSLADDPTGDQIDALLCAIQAAWSWTQRDRGFGAPAHFDALEGWIADPKCRIS